MYVTYDYYKNTYNGSLVEQASFPSYELKARKVLENYTLKPKKQIEKVLEGQFSDDVKLAMCELIDSIKNYESLLETAKMGQLRQMSGLSSESIKDHSISIDKNGKNAVLKLEEDTEYTQIKIMRKYLLSSGLLYRGL